MKSPSKIALPIPEFEDDFAQSIYDAIWLQKETSLKHWPRELFEREPSPSVATPSPQQNPFRKDKPGDPSVA